MMRRKMAKKFLILAVAALLLSSCSDAEAVDHSERERRVSSERDDEATSRQVDDAQKDEQISDPALELQTYEEIYKRLLQIDDENGMKPYKWDDDFYLAYNRESVRMQDCINYALVFGYEMPDKSILYHSIDANGDIPDYYKQLFKNWVDRWSTNYEGSDLTILNENIKSIKVNELNPDELALESISATALASYMRADNVINVNKTAEKNARFEEIFYHEITHAAANYSRREKNGNFIAKNYKPNDVKALYTEEALDTLFTAWDNPAGLYPLFVNYYRMIINEIGYTGQDYLNHSIRELIEKIDVSMGDVCSGEEFLRLIENAGTYVYGAKSNANVDEIRLLNQIVIKAYLKFHGPTSFEMIYDMINKDILKSRDIFDPIIGEKALREDYEKALQE